MRIYIPTRGRQDKQITLQNLPQELRNKASLVFNYEEKNIAQSLDTGVPAHIAHKECNTIGKIRQYIIETHDIKQYGPKLIMLDDDLGFNMRRTDIRQKFLPATDEAVIKGFQLVEELLESHAHGGIRARQMSQDAPDIEYNCRTLRALAYNTTILRKENINFDRLIVMEDFDVTLQLLRKGYSNFNISSIIQGQGSSNAPGGCSLYRNHERQAEGANGLASHHPGLVKVKETKTNWQGWGSDKRIDVMVSWKKAYKEGVQNNGEQKINEHNRKILQHSPRAL